MDKQLYELMSRETPKINPDIANGLAMIHIPLVERYLDNVMRSASRGFPAGFEYVGCERCTPLEEFHEVTRPRNNKRAFDVARSDIYMMKYFFKFNGVLLPPKFIYLPFISEGGTITLGGARFVISPLLSDKVISPGLTSVFVRLLRDKLTFEKIPHNVVINNKRETTQVVWALIYHRPASLKKLRHTVKAKCSIVHYLLCKYGFSEMFRRFCNCAPIIGTHEINTTNYPASDWVICSSTKLKPRGFGKYDYTGTEIKLAIKKEEFSETVKAYVGGFFYVLDHFPSRIIPEFVDNTRIWIVLMGHIIFSGTISEGKLFDSIAEHLSSLDEYIDALIGVKLKEIGYECEDVYHLFALVIDNFNDWTLNATDKVSSMYGKELDILYNVLYGITSAIFNFNFKLKTAAKKGLTEKEILITMNLVLKTGLIFSLTRQHVNMSTVSYSGDNKFFKITSILVPQSSANKNTAKRSRESIKDPMKCLDVSIAEFGGYSNLPKSNPTGHARINPHAKINDSGSMIQDPEKLHLLSSVREMIRRS